MHFHVEGSAEPPPLAFLDPLHPYLDVEPRGGIGMSGPLKIRVGLTYLEPHELGFQRYETRTITAEGCCGGVQPRFYEYILYRHGEPLIIMERTWVWIERPTIRLADFPKAIIHHYDYPTKPFLKAIRILKRQADDFMDLLAEGAQRGFMPVEAGDYIDDLMGLLRFALKMRGQEIRLEIGWPYMNRIRGLWERIEEAIAEAEEPVPGVGNRGYIDIAREAFELLRPAVGLYRAVARSLGQL